MTTQIIVSINHDPDGKRCGACRYQHYEYGFGKSCHVWGGQLFYRDPHIAGIDTPKRHPACLYNEKLLADLVAAGNELEYSRRDLNDGHDGMTRAWDRAIAAVKKEG